MRAFGFRPAVEPGVLKREWHGLAVRVSAGGMRAARPGEGELAWIAEGRTLLLDGEPYPGGGAGIALVENLLDLIAAYERWVEAREGREGRIQRGRSGPPDQPAGQRPRRDPPPPAHAAGPAPPRSLTRRGVPAPARAERTAAGDALRTCRARPRP